MSYKIFESSGPGIYHGSLDTSGGLESESLTVDTKLMPYPTDDSERSSKPMAIVLTEFHVLILFPDRLKAVCVLNEQLIHEDTFSEVSMKGLTVMIFFI